MREKVVAGVSRAKKQSMGKRMVNFLPVYAMAMPGLIYLFINNYMPLPGLVLAFKSYNARDGIWGSPWAGLSNFTYLFQNDAGYITRNTIFYNLAFIVINTVLAIAIAVVLSEMTNRMKKFYQSAILLPYLLSSVIVAYLVFAFLGVENGFLNRTVLPLFGIEPVNWYTETSVWPFILILVNAWKSVGYNCIVYLATIMGFDRAFYEAAIIDGASKVQQVFRITIPMLKGTIVMLTLLAIGRIFYSDFGLFYQVPMNTGALYPVTQTIDTYVYRGLLEVGNITMSAAAGAYQSLVGFILVLGANLVVRKVDRENALF